MRQVTNRIKAGLGEAVWSLIGAITVGLSILVGKRLSLPD